MSETYEDYWEKHGVIEITRRENPTGHLERFDYAWKGGPLTYIPDHMRHEFPSLGEPLLQVDPYRLRRVEDEMNWMRGDWLYVREDSPGWWMRIALHRLSAWAGIFYCRIILTLAVWNLADHHPAFVPSWRDVHALKWLAAKLAQRRKR